MKTQTRMQEMMTTYNVENVPDHKLKQWCSYLQKKVNIMKKEIARRRKLKNQTNV